MTLPPRGGPGTRAVGTAGRGASETSTPTLCARVPDSGGQMIFLQGPPKDIRKQSYLRHDS